MTGGSEEVERRHTWGDSSSQGESWYVSGPSPSKEHRTWDLPDWTRSGRPHWQHPAGMNHLLVLLLMGALIAVLLGAVFLLPTEHEAKEQTIPFRPEGELKPVSSVSFNARLLWTSSLTPPASEDQGAGQALLPADAAVINGRLFVLDAAGGRILQLNEQGQTVSVLDSRDDLALSLRGAAAMADHEGNLYVADSQAGSVIVVDPAGTVNKVIIPQTGGSERPLRPVGIAVSPQGHIFLSDPDNHRVLHLDAEGRPLSSIGRSDGDSGQHGLNSPGGLALDGLGNLYVVDTLGYQVMKYSPDGRFILSVGNAGNTAGTSSRPKAVAVDEGGNIYVSDGLLVAVVVFGSDGALLGFIGRRNPDDAQSASGFQEPHGLKLAGNRLYVIDRTGTLFAFQVGA